MVSPDRSLPFMSKKRHKIKGLYGIICGLNMTDRTPMRKELGTVQKQLGAPWQKIPPPQQALQIYLPAQPVFEQTSF